MARVNRTTGIFLVLGVAALLGTVAGARFMMGPDDKPTTSEPTDLSDVYCLGYVDVAGGLVMPGPSVPGRVQLVKVKDGESVKNGDVLVVLEDREARDKLEVAKQRVIAARARLASAQEQVQNEIKAHGIKVLEQEGVVNRAESACSLAEAHVGQARRYVERSAPGGKDALENAELELRLAKKERETAESALAKLKTLEPKTSLREYEEEIKVQELEVGAATKALENYVIKSPCDGTVVEINYQVGGQCPLPPGDAFANRAIVILPTGPMIVRAEVDQDWAMLIKAGQTATVSVRAAGGREFTWSGKVQRFSMYMQKRRVRTMEPDQWVDTKTRECVIAFDSDPKNDQLVQGMRVSVQIHTAK